MIESDVESVMPTLLSSRPALTEDIAFLTDCFLRSMLESISAARGSWDESRERAQFERQLDLRATKIIKSDDSDVGFLTVVEGDRNLQLHTLCIAPEHQACGIGSSVARDVIALASQTRREVVLSVLKVNRRAEAFYARLGFTVVGESEHHRQMRHGAADNDLTLRIAAETDIGAVEALLYACLDDMRRSGIDQWDEIYPSRETLLADIRGGTMHLAFNRPGTLLSAIVLNEIESLEWSVAHWTVTDVPVLVVHRLMVDPAHQGRGIARDMMRFAESHARASGYGALRLDAFSRNPRALRLYQRLGYRDVESAVLRKGVFRCFEKDVRGRP